MNEQADIVTVVGLVERMSKTPDVLAIVVRGDPPSKARPRFNGRGQVYTPKRTIEGEQRYIAAMVGLPTFHGNVAVACLFRRSNRHRIDVDNLLKAVLDAATKANVWDDDSQVTALIGIVEHDAENPRSVICFGDHASSLARGTDAMVACTTCGKRFSPLGTERQAAARSYCSRACRRLEAKICAHCGASFQPTANGQKYCSVKCRGLARRVSRPCARCGKQRANSSSTICRDCFLGEHSEVAA